MDTKAAILALITAWGVGTCAAIPASAQDSTLPAEVAAEADNDDPLLNRVWVKHGDESSRPGVMHIFLSDGTLVSDSCWETYRLSSWQRISDTEISWDEDGMAINAEIGSVTAEELVLTLKLIGGDETQTFTPADVPYVCPDIPR